jgi:hypothetical protein
MRRAGDQWRGTSLAIPLILYRLVEIASELERAETRFRDSLPSLAELGVTDRRIAHRARLVARIPEKVRRAYVEVTEEPTERGLHRYAKGQQRSLARQPRYWVSPRDLKRWLEAEVYVREVGTWKIKLLTAVSDLPAAQPTAR